ncbi:MAG: hypothetical protein KAT65_10155, partial [Methanophagales archaeon]|nr:hypothetical protein [Methanophagales archaeon]
MICKLKTWMLKWQSCPTSKDLKNEELKKLAERLKGNSEKETLTNILEWQERNIQAWIDRYLLHIVLIFLIFPFLCILWRLPCPFLIKLILFILSLLVVLADIIYLIPVVLVLFTYLILLLVIATYQGPKNLLLVVQGNVIFYAVLFGGIIGIICYLIVKCKHFVRNRPKVKIYEVLSDIFCISLPVNKILKYRLAICRDYAKLTAALLFSIYPISKVYFFAIPRHVASAVKINGKYYVLDQKLPVLTKPGWLNRWNRKDANVYVSKLIRNSEGIPIDVTFSWHGQINRKLKIEIPKVGTEELTERITNILGIEQSSQKDKPDFEIPLSNYAIYYDDDEITKYSLIRAIKNKLESELCSN